MSLPEKRKFLSTDEALKVSGYNRDYLVSLCRSGSVNAERDGRNWNIDPVSLTAFMKAQKARKEEFHKSLSSERKQSYQQARAAKEDGLVGVGEALKLSGYNRDYLISLCRSGSVTAKQEGRKWRIDPLSLASFVEQQKIRKEKFHESLSESRKQTYRAVKLAHRFTLLRRAGAGAIVAVVVTAAALSIGNGLPVVKQQAAVATASLGVGERSALATYEAIHGLFGSVANLFFPTPRISPAIVVTPATATTTPVAVATATPVIAPTPAPRVVTVNSYPTYTTTTFVKGVSSDLLTQGLSSLRTELLTAISARIQPIQTQVATNENSIQQVSMIQSLTSLILHTPVVDGATITASNFTNGNNVNAVNGAFTNFTAGTTALSTTTLTGDLTVSGTTTVANLLATSATSTNLFATNFVAGAATTTNFFSTNSVATSATSTNLFASAAHIASGIFDNFTSTLATIGGLTTTNSTSTNATSTNLFATNFVFANASSTGSLYLGGTFAGAGLTSCSGSSAKLLWNSTTKQFQCGADAGAGGGITALGAQYSTYQTGSTQTFATSSDTNIGLIITSGSDTQTFTPTWIGTLADNRIASAATWNAKQAALSFTYPIVNTANTISLAFGTTTANAWSNLQSFTNASSSQLSVFQNAYFGGTATSTFTSTGALGIASSSPWAQLSVNPDALGSGVPEFAIGSSTATHFIVTGAGNVGIGTSSPAAKLYVENTGGNALPALNANDIAVLNNTVGNNTNLNLISSASATIGFGNSTSKSLGAILYTMSSNTMAFQTNNSQKMFLDTNGLLGVGTSTPYAVLSVSTSTANYSGQTLFSVANSSNTSLFTVLGNGNVGIGTTSPFSILGISGTAPVVALADTTGGGSSYLLRSGIAGLNTFDIFDVKGNTSMLKITQNSINTGQVMIGTTSNNITGNNSRLFVFGGANGANIDAMGDQNLSGGAGDTVSIEAEGSDYNNIGANLSSIAIRYYGPASSALFKVLGIPAQRMGILDFGMASTSIIQTQNATPIRFGINLAEIMQLSQYGLGVGSTSPFARFSIGGAAGTSTPLFLAATSTAGFATSTVAEIDSAGNFLAGLGGAKVGIGTTNPQTMLDVYSPTTSSAVRSVGTFALGSGSGGGFIAVNNASSTAPDQRLGGLFLGTYDGTAQLLSTAIQAFSSQAWSPTARGSYLTFGVTPNNSVTRSEVMRIDQNGNVGIGTTSPNSPFIVRGSTGSFGQTAKFSSGQEQTGAIGNQFNITNSDTSWGLLEGFDGPNTTTSSYHGANSAYLINVQNGPLYMGVNNAPNITILAAGNVGVGTTSPLYKLTTAVAGDDRIAIDETTNSNYGFLLSYQGVPKAQIYSNGSTGDLRFHMANVGAAMTILQSNGNVGIGTTSPTSMLEVGAGVGSPQLTINGGTGVSGPYMRFNQNSATTAYFGLDSAILGTTNTDITLYNNSGGFRAYAGASLSKSLVLSSTGNVGIGTTTPTANFQVIVPGGHSSSVAVNTYASSDDNPAIRLYRSDGGGSFFPFVISNGYTGQPGLGTLVFSSGNDTAQGSETLTPRMVIQNGGNVGIGTTSPQRLLHISGVNSPEILLENTSVTYNVQGRDWGISSQGTGGSSSLMFRALPSDLSSNLIPLVITSNGLIGIGSTTPANLLSISVPNAVNADSGIVLDRASGASTFGLKFRSDASGNYRGAFTLKGNGSAALEAMSIIVDGGSSGNVGIGSTTPSSKLVVYKGSSGGAPYPSAANPDAAITLESSGRGVMQFLTPSSADSEGFYFGDQVTPIEAQIMWQPNVKSFYITGGNVGIGDVSPAAKMSVITANDVNPGQITAWDTRHFVVGAGGANGGGIALSYNQTNHIGYITTVRPNAAWDSMYFNANDYQFMIASGTPPALRVANSGYVGIGTTTPLSNLSIVSTSGSQLPTSGRNPTSSILSLKSSANNALFMGVDTGSPFGGWLQMADVTNLGQPYPFALNPNGGNVGVGTTTPQSKLTIAGTTNVAGALIVGNNSQYGDFVQFTDTFDGAVINTNNWTVLGSASQSGSVSITGHASWNDDITSVQSFRRTNSLTLTADVSTAGIGNYYMIGFSSDATGNYLTMPHAIYFVNGGSMQIYENGASVASASYTWAANTVYRVRVSVTTTGARYYISSNAGDTWTLLYDGTGNNVTNSPLYVRVSVYGNNNPTVVDNVSVSNGQDVLVDSQFLDKNLTLGKGSLLVNNGNIGVWTNAPRSGLDVATSSSNGSGYGIATLVNTHATVGDYVVAVAGGPNSNDTSTNLLRFTDAGFNTLMGTITRNGTNAVAYNTTSDLRLKENIATTTRGLSTLLQIPIDDFSFKNDVNHTIQQGYIAQDLYNFYPEAVHVGGADAAKDPWSVDYGRITPLLAKSIQELNAKFEDHMQLLTASTTLEAIAGLPQLASTTIALAARLATDETRVTSLEARVAALESGSISMATTTIAAAGQSFTTTLSSGLTNALGGVATGSMRYIGDSFAAGVGAFTKIFAGEVHTDKLCVSDSGGETCVTRSQLNTLLGVPADNGQGSGNNGNSGGGNSNVGSSTPPTAPDTAPPVVSLVGDASMQIAVGDTFTDPGATALDDVDGDLTSHITVSGSVDTSTAGSYTLTYSVTDAAGNTGTITRTVIVQ